MSESNKRSQRAYATASVVTQLAMALLSLTAGVFAIVVYSLPQNYEKNIECPIDRIQIFTLVFGVSELCCFVLAVLSPMIYLIEVRLREGFHPGLVSQCLIVLRVLLGFVSAGFLIKNAHSYFTSLCNVELATKTAYTAMMITGLCIISIFILVVVVVFALFLIYGCFTMKSEPSKNSSPKASKYDQVQDEDFVEQEHHQHDAAVVVSSEEEKRESNIRINRNNEQQ
ncbi:hypothetical protein C9374_011398 [Naegleria lovaniensis]|uniref:Uncharacterized protein n=1 Tax=Naegleria lovaniensis TaxID=51637 RepID=A0AA88GX67_NAELO|nr:uncharacterized protein C9374_011398 [Naegleria lovaniensis]KAG2392673.1 hypothetical protein C9374_011398 [Naegleria lovaniensis]